MKELLRALDLRVVEWEEAVAATGNTSPFVDEIVLAGLDRSDAVVVLATADDLVQLRGEFVEDSDEPIERELRAQPRANVIYEAGIARANHPGQTVIAEVGRVKLFSDIAGRTGRSR